MSHQTFYIVDDQGRLIEEQELDGAAYLKHGPCTSTRVLDLKSLSIPEAISALRAVIASLVWERSRNAGQAPSPSCEKQITSGPIFSVNSDGKLVELTMMDERYVEAAEVTIDNLNADNARLALMAVLKVMQVERETARNDISWHAWELHEAFGLTGYANYVRRPKDLVNPYERPVDGLHE